MCIKNSLHVSKCCCHNINKLSDLCDPRRSGIWIEGNPLIVLVTLEVSLSVFGYLSLPKSKDITVSCFLFFENICCFNCFFSCSLFQNQFGDCICSEYTSKLVQCILG